VKAVAQAHRLDCETAAVDCRFIIQSENEDEAVELAKNHMREVHGKDYTDEVLRGEHLQIV
jgi:predicted small metal-binding protein